MRLDTELVMLLMLFREGMRCADLARGVARLRSFSPSGLAFLACFAIVGVCARSPYAEVGLRLNRRRYAESVNSVEC